MSVASGDFFLSVTASVIRPEDYEDMTVYYYTDDDDTSVKTLTEDKPFQIMESTKYTLFGRVGSEFSGATVYDYHISHPQFTDTVSCRSVDVSDSAEIVLYAMFEVKPPAENIIISDGVNVSDFVVCDTGGYVDI